MHALLAIAFGVLSFTAVSCHDDDDEPKQEPVKKS